VCLSVCLCVCGHVSGTTRAIFINFSVRVAYGRGSVLLRQGDEIQKETGSFGGFFPLTMHCNAFAAKGIIRSPITLCSRRDHAVTAAFAANGIGGEGAMGVQCAGDTIAVLIFLTEITKPIHCGPTEHHFNFSNNSVKNKSILVIFDRQNPQKFHTTRL